MNEAPETRFDFRPVVCGVCGSDRFRFLGYRGGRAHRDGSGVWCRIVRCRECSHIYPSPMPIPARGLDDLYTDTGEYFRGHEVEVKKRVGLEKLRHFEARLGCRGRFLDVGCGRGEFLWAAREAGWEYAGVDPSSTYLEWGRQNLGVEGRLGTLEEARFPDNYFDAISMAALIEHLYEPYNTLCEVGRVLRPGGFVWLDAPNEDGLYMRVGNLYMRLLGRDWVVNLAPTFPPYHVQGFNPRSLRRLLTRAGFDIEWLKVWGSTWQPRGKPSVRKEIEYYAARLVNCVGNRYGAGTYMDIWAKKPSQ